jgi:hypothetical protein
MPDDVTVIVEIGEKNMAIDLSDNVAAMLLKEGSESHQALMNDIRHNGSNVHNLTRLSAFKKFDQLGIGESRAESGLIATPVASPTTASPGQ